MRKMIDRWQYKAMAWVLKSKKGQALSEYALYTWWVVFPLFFIRYNMPGADGIRRTTIEWLFWGFNQYVLGFFYILVLPIG